MAPIAAELIRRKESSLCAKNCRGALHGNAGFPLDNSVRSGAYAAIPGRQSAHIRDSPMPPDAAETARASQPVVSPLAEKDLPEAERILRLAFGTFLGAPEPETFWSDRDYVYGRWHSPHVASFGAMLDGKLVGSTFATKWGSVGFLGPITVHPDRHEGGIGRALLAETMRQFDDWGARHVGLFTFAHSAKHVALYQKYDFYARFLTAIMSAPVGSRQKSAALMRFSGLSTAQQREALHSCRNVADALYAGLDLTEEIRATNAQGVGDTILIEGGGGIVGFAVCHYGPRSEAAPTIASLNSVRCATAPRPNRIIFACSTHARLWRSRLACPTCWRVRTWRATRPTAILSRADFARQFRASPCTGTMTPAIVGPVPTSSTIGVNRSSSICRF